MNRAPHALLLLIALAAVLALFLWEHERGEQAAARVMPDNIRSMHLESAA